MTLNNLNDWLKNATCPQCSQNALICLSSVTCTLFLSPRMQVRTDLLDAENTSKMTGICKCGHQAPLDAFFKQERSDVPVFLEPTTSCIGCGTEGPVWGSIQRPQGTLYWFGEFDGYICLRCQESHSDFNSEMERVRNEDDVVTGDIGYLLPGFEISPTGYYGVLSFETAKIPVSFRFEEESNTIKDVGLAGARECSSWMLAVNDLERNIRVWKPENPSSPKTVLDCVLKRWGHRGLLTWN